MKNWKKDLSDFYEEVKEIEKKRQEMEEEIEKEKSKFLSFYSLKVVP